MYRECGLWESSDQAGELAQVWTARCYGTKIQIVDLKQGQVIQIVSADLEQGKYSVLESDELFVIVGNVEDTQVLETAQWEQRLVGDATHKVNLRDQRTYSARHLDAPDNWGQVGLDVGQMQSSQAMLILGRNVFQIVLVVQPVKHLTNVGVNQVLEISQILDGYFNPFVGDSRTRHIQLGQLTALLLFRVKADTEAHQTHVCNWTAEQVEVKEGLTR